MMSDSKLLAGLSERVRLGCRFGGRQGRVIRSEIANLFVTKCLGDRAHRLALSASAPKVHKLPLCIIVGLPSERRDERHLRDAVLAMARRANGRQVLACRGVRRRSSPIDEKRKKRRDVLQQRGRRR